MWRAVRAQFTTVLTRRNIISTNMKCAIVFLSCVLAAASAGFSAYGPSSYNGVPLVHGGYAQGGNYGPLPVQDTYEVAAAKAAHFQAHAAATAQANAAPLAHGYAHAAPAAHGYAHGGNYGAVAPLPVQDTYEVAAAKAAHFQAHAAATAQAHAAPLAHGYAHAAPAAYGYAHAAPVAHGYAHGGNYGTAAPLPVQDTYEVAAAKAAHFQAHAAATAQANAAPFAHGYAQAAPAAHSGYYGAGVPQPVQDTYEVAAAKAAHFQAHAAVKSGHHGSY